MCGAPETTRGYLASFQQSAICLIVVPFSSNEKGTTETSTWNPFCCSRALTLTWSTSADSHRVKPQNPLPTLPHEHHGWTMWTWFSELLIMGGKLVLVCCIVCCSIKCKKIDAAINFLPKWTQKYCIPAVVIIPFLWNVSQKLQSNDPDKACNAPLEQILSVRLGDGWILIQQDPTVPTILWQTVQILMLMNVWLLPQSHQNRLAGGLLGNPLQSASRA